MFSAWALSAGAVAGVDDGFESAFFVGGVAFDGFDEIGNEVVAALELDVDIGPGVVGLDFETDEGVVHADEDDDGEDDQAKNRVDHGEDLTEKCGREWPTTISLYVRRVG